MNELVRHIEILLLSNDCVIVPDFGGFTAHYVDARYDGRDNMFLPPTRTIGFNPQLKINDSLLAQSYVEVYDISYPEALKRIAADVNEIRQELGNEGKFELSDIGVLYLNENGVYNFEPCEAGILTPDLYGLGGVDMLPLSAIASPVNTAESSNGEQETADSTLKYPFANTTIPTVAEDEEEESNQAEFILIKKSWARNIAAACIALIAFFAISQPLGNPSIQKSQIDTGMLTRIMPKEIIKNGPAQMTLSVSKKALVAKTEADKNEINDSEEKQEIKNTSPYYSIVLASRVTKRNAAEYVERLQAKGIKEARVLITPNNVKVIYGNYPSENAAYSALNRLHGNETFSDSWITQVNE